MADHAIKLEAWVGGAWTEVTTEALGLRGTQITRGMSDNWEPRAGTVSWTFLDPTEKWRPTNPASTVYGQAGRAMPVRVSVGTDVRLYAEAYSFQPDPGNPGEQPKVVLSAAGLLHRIGKWEDTLRSPIRRMLDGQTGSLYIPGEDPSGSARASSAIAGAPAAWLTEASTGENEDVPGGSGGAITLRTAGTSRIYAAAPRWRSPATGYSVMVYARIPTTITPDPVTLLDVRATGRVTRWLVQIRDTSVNLTGYDADGATVATANGGVGTVDIHEWFALQLEVVEDGSDSDANVIYHQVGETDFFVTSTATYSGAANSVTGVFVVAPVDDTLFCHLWAGDHALPFVDSSFQQVSSGYAGETTADRWLRVMSEAGIARSIIGTAAESTRMGPQKPDTLLNIIKEIIRTEDGLTSDSRNAVRQVFRTRKSLYAQTPKIELTWGVDVAPPLQEAIDDQGVWNTVTVTDRSGAEASAVVTEGPLSTADAPDGIGVIRGDLDVNLWDPAANLPLMAQWWANRGTAKGLAGDYRQLTIDLDATPSLAAAVATVEIGDVITIAGRDPDLISLLVLNQTETVQNKSRVVVYTCVRATLWQEIGTWDDGTGTVAQRRIGSRTTTLDGGVDATDTSWTVQTMARPGWSLCDALIGGERVTLTAVGAVTGSSPYTQTWTVTRSVNGVAKAHADGTPIHVFDGARWGRK